MDEKKCSKCGEVKMAESFHLNKHTKDGLHPQCKQCRKEYFNDRATVLGRVILRKANARELELDANRGNLKPSIVLCGEKHYKCSRCEKWKPLSVFAKTDKSTRHAYCRECASKRTRAYCKANREKAAATNRKFARRHPERTAAYHEVSAAKARGEIVQPAQCQVCGHKKEGRLLHGHHRDYSKPFDLVWVCALCHKLIHSQDERSSNGDRNQETRMQALQA